MALGAITVPEFAGRGSSPVCFDVLSFAGESSYAAGGSDFAAAAEAAIAAGREIMAVVPVDCGGYLPQFDKSNGKLKVYYGNYDAADGPLIEVANATNLSGVTFKVLVISR